MKQSKNYTRLKCEGGTTSDNHAQIWGAGSPWIHGFTMVPMAKSIVTTPTHATWSFNFGVWRSCTCQELVGFHMFKYNTRYVSMNIWKQSNHHHSAAKACSDSAGKWWSHRQDSSASQSPTSPLAKQTRPTLRGAGRWAKDDRWKFMIWLTVDVYSRVQLHQSPKSIKIYSFLIILSCCDWAIPWSSLFSKPFPR